LATGGLALFETHGVAAGEQHMEMKRQEAHFVSLDRIREARLLFSHHSVGGNILDGVRAIAAAAGPASGPALIAVSGGRNGEPFTKVDYFVSVLRRSDIAPDLAFMKLCYADFNPSTDVSALFEYYRSAMANLRRERPGVRMAHMTVPLTTWPTELKWRVYRTVGKQVWEDEANAKRAAFNELLKMSFVDDSVFDLAAVESTAPAGERVMFRLRGQSYPALYKGYSDDGGHLNALGRQVVARRFVDFLAKALENSAAH
jgi:hypothetical protein